MTDIVFRSTWKCDKGVSTRSLLYFLSLRVEWDLGKAFLYFLLRPSPYDQFHIVMSKVHKIKPDIPMLLDAVKKHSRYHMAENNAK